MRDTSMWKVSYEGENNPTDFQNKADDAYTGDIAFHFWSGDSDMNFPSSRNLRILRLEPISFRLLFQFPREVLSLPRHQ